MRSALAIVAALGIVVGIRCNDKDTKSGDVWPRSVEPRLTSAPEWRRCATKMRAGRVVPEASCGAPVLANEPCDDLVADHRAALRMLSVQPQCTDAALEALQRLAPASDVAAAFYVRAQRNDNPSDFLYALQWSERALAANPRSPEARFNHALTLEALGLFEDAALSWNELVKIDRSPWAAEARERRHRQEQDGALIERFPAAAQRHFEEVLLPQMAESPASSRSFAAALSVRLGDRFPLEIIESIEKASPQTRAILQEGFRALRDARAADRAFDPNAKSLYQRSARLLASGDNPLHLTASLSVALATSFERVKGEARALDLLDPIEREAQSRGYRYLLTRTRTARAYFVSYQGGLTEARALYDAALAEYAALRDGENIAGTLAATAGVFHTAGHYDLAWRDAYRAVRELPNVADPKTHLKVLGAASSVALSLEHPRIALLYQNAAVKLLDRERIATPPERAELIRAAQRRLAIALRQRAGIRLRLEQYQGARNDLGEAMRLAPQLGGMDANIRRVLQARTEDVQGQALLGLNPSGSVQAFTSALANTSTEFRTFRALLLARRAEALRHAGRRTAAETDLRAALDELRAEETAILSGRTPGQHEDIWSAYFSRFRDTYRHLIRQLIEDGRAGEAFVYAERERAFEPLDLIRRNGLLPADFPVLNTPKDLPRIRKALPPGTFLLQYCVLDDRTYVWIVSRDKFELVSLRAGASAIERWRAALQNAASNRNAAAFEDALRAPFDELLNEPLSRIQKPARLVFIPDEAMHGIPLAVLRDPDNDRYVFQAAPVEIAGSTLLYLYSLARDRALPGTSRPAVLLVGNPEIDPNSPFKLGRLPGAENEVLRIRELYSGAQSLIGPQATVPEFLRRVRGKDLAHIAAHAIPNARTPARSTILLAPSDGRTGALEAQELVADFEGDRTRLVVLATCSSAGGLPVGPEGVAPLVRPLMTAGVPAVVGSLWEINDATAKEFLVSFHQHYRDGMDAAQAMRAAQLEMLEGRNRRLQPVFTWAPFQVIGHASPPSGPTTQNDIQKDKEKPP